MTNESKINETTGDYRPEPAMESLVREDSLVDPPRALQEARDAWTIAYHQTDQNLDHNPSVTPRIARVSMSVSRASIKASSRLQNAQKHLDMDAVVQSQENYDDTAKDYREPESIVNTSPEMTEEPEINETTGLLRQSSDNDNKPESIGGKNPLDLGEAPDPSANLLKKKKKKRIKLTKAGAMMLERQVQMMMTKHNLAAKFFEFRQFWFFTVPQALLAMVVSVLAFLATTELVDDTTKVFLNTITGSASVIVVFIQTIAGICNYGTRAHMHQVVTLDLRDLRDDMVLLRFKLKLDYQQQGKDPDGKTDDDEQDEGSTELDFDFESIRSRFLQTLSGCKSVVPMKLMEAFHGIKSNMMVSETRSTAQYFTNTYDDSLDVCYERMGFKVYDILASEILGFSFFPLTFPEPTVVIETTMKRLKEEMLTYNSFWLDDAPVEERCCC